MTEITVGGRKVGTVRIERWQSMIGAPLRMFAHFDALDGDEDTDEVQPRYELLFPQDHYLWRGDAQKALAAKFEERLWLAFANGSSV